MAVLPLRRCNNGTHRQDRGHTSTKGAQTKCGRLEVRHSQHREHARPILPPLRVRFNVVCLCGSFTPAKACQRAPPSISRPFKNSVCPY